MSHFNTRMSIPDFINLISTTLANNLSSDFGEEAHVVDMLASSLTNLEGIFEFMSNYPTSINMKDQYIPPRSYTIDIEELSEESANKIKKWLNDSK